MPLSPTALKRILDRHPPSPRYWVAYSGGLDSRVLLELCAELRRQHPHYGFAAVHAHHGLQAAAEAWAEHCRDVAASHGLPFTLLRVDARPAPGQSPEEAARAARYAALRELIAPGETVLTAQHREDQAETLLLQLLRGAGLAGLAAMPERAAFGSGFLLRPLLARSREELRRYAEERRLSWVEDPTNRDPAFDRNFIRHAVMPLLADRWPAVADTLSRTARHCAEAQSILDGVARDLLRSVRHPERPTLWVEPLRTYSEADRRLVLREWLKSRRFRPPPAKVLEQVLAEGLNARPDRNPVIRWSEGEIRRYRDELYLRLPERPFDGGAVIPWDGISPLPLPDGNGTLTAARQRGLGIAPAVWRSGVLTVRYRRGGEACRPAGRAGTHEIKKLFQEAGIPPWVRPRVPLVFIGGELAAVGGWWVDAAFAGDRDSENIQLNWQAPDGRAGAG
jgi:tRNA(Ile)-lysidine synthase